MEALETIMEEPPMNILSRIIKRIKCKMSCCYKSSCSMNDEAPLE